MRLSGYVNTNYLFSLTEEDADEEQQKFYRFRQRPRLSFYLNIWFKSNIYSMNRETVTLSIIDKGWNISLIYSAVVFWLHEMISGYMEGLAGRQTQIQ